MIKSTVYLSIFRQNLIIFEGIVARGTTSPFLGSLEYWSQKTGLKCWFMNFLSEIIATWFRNTILNFIKIGFGRWLHCLFEGAQYLQFLLLLWREFRLGRELFLIFRPEWSDRFSDGIYFNSERASARIKDWVITQLDILCLLYPLHTIFYLFRLATDNINKHKTHR